MPDMWSASAVLLLRFSISQMDVPGYLLFVFLLSTLSFPGALSIVWFLFPTFLCVMRFFCLQLDKRTWQPLLKMMNDLLLLASPTSFARLVTLTFFHFWTRLFIHLLSLVSFVCCSLSGVTMSPSIAGYLLASPPASLLFSVPFFLAGALKIVYDLTLFCVFMSTRSAKLQELGPESQQQCQEVQSRQQQQQQPSTEGVSSTLTVPLLKAQSWTVQPCALIVDRESWRVRWPVLSLPSSFLSSSSSSWLVFLFTIFAFRHLPHFDLLPLTFSRSPHRTGAEKKWLEWSQREMDHRSRYH